MLGLKAGATITWLIAFKQGLSLTLTLSASASLLTSKPCNSMLPAPGLKVHAITLGFSQEC